jgi:nitroreductase
MTIENTTLEVIARRYSCKSFNGLPVEKEKLEAIALAGAQAPSSSNMQGWRIIVVSDKNYIDYLDALTMEGIRLTNPIRYERILKRSGGRALFNAPVLVVLAAPSSASYSVDMDCGIVGQNIVLAATALGLASCFLRRVSTAILGLEKQEIYETLGIPEGYEFSIGIILGYPELSRDPHEPDESKISFIEKAEW